MRVMQSDYAQPLNVGSDEMVRCLICAAAHWIFDHFTRALVNREKDCQAFTLVVGSRNGHNICGRSNFFDGSSGGGG